MNKILTNTLECMDESSCYSQLATPNRGRAKVKLFHYFKTSTIYHGCVLIMSSEGIFWESVSFVVGIWFKPFKNFNYYVAWRRLSQTQSSSLCFIHFLEYFDYIGSVFSSYFICPLQLIFQPVGWYHFWCFSGIEAVSCS
jgi:hypothetical protein